MAASPAPVVSLIRMEPTPAAELRFDGAAYSLDALQRAAYRLAASAASEFRVEGSDLVCSLYPAGDEVDAAALAYEMRTLALDEVLRERIRTETAAVRNTILALAFSRTGLTDNETSPGGTLPAVPDPADERSDP